MGNLFLLLILNFFITQQPLFLFESVIYIFLLWDDFSRCQWWRQVDIFVFRTFLLYISRSIPLNFERAFKRICSYKISFMSISLRSTHFLTILNIRYRISSLKKDWPSACHTRQWSNNIFCIYLLKNYRGNFKCLNEITFYAKFMMIITDMFTIVMLLLNK